VDSEDGRGRSRGQSNGAASLGFGRVSCAGRSAWPRCSAFSIVTAQFERCRDVLGAGEE
jgi:hypothetical protein